jgi:hypothetical protein
MEPYGENFIPVVPVDQTYHTNEHPFCYDPTCPCHEEQGLIAPVAQHVRDGFLTPSEATDFVNGKTL